MVSDLLLRRDGHDLRAAPCFHLVARRNSPLTNKLRAWSRDTRSLAKDDLPLFGSSKTFGHRPVRPRNQRAPKAKDAHRGPVREPNTCLCSITEGEPRRLAWGHQPKLTFLAAMPASPLESRHRTRHGARVLRANGRHSKRKRPPTEAARHVLVKT